MNRLNLRRKLAANVASAIIAAVFGLALAGCKKAVEPVAVPAADAASSAAAASASEAAAATAASGTAFLKDQRDALNKAKALEAQMQQQAGERDKAMNEATK